MRRRKLNKKKFLRFLLFVVLGILVAVIIYLNWSVDKATYTTLPEDQITVIKDGQSPVYVPKGMIIAGDAFEAAWTDRGLGKVSDVKEGKVAREFLASTDSAFVVYPEWVTEEEARRELLD